MYFRDPDYDVLLTTGPPFLKACAKIYLVYFACIIGHEQVRMSKLINNNRNSFIIVNSVLDVPSYEF